MTTSVGIRPATSADAAALRTFRCANPNEKWTRDVERIVQTVVADAVDRADPETEVTVAHVGDDIVGVVAAALGDAELDEPTLTIHTLSVSHCASLAYL